MKLHPLGLDKKNLLRQVLAASPGTESHLAAIQSYHRLAWECFSLRNAMPPQLRAQYCYYVSVGDVRGKPPVARKAVRNEVDPRTEKAMRAVDRDAERCWQELHRAIDATGDGTRSKIRSLDALSHWRKEYDRQWAQWLARGRKRLPPRLAQIKAFADHNGSIHLVGGERYFATAREAERYMRNLRNDEVKEWAQSETNLKLQALFERATAENDEAMWQQIKEGLGAEAEDGDGKASKTKTTVRHGARSVSDARPKKTNDLATLKGREAEDGGQRTRPTRRSCVDRETARRVEEPTAARHAGEQNYPRDEEAATVEGNN